MKVSLAAGMILNESGWFVTAGHVLTQIHELDQQASNPGGGRRRKKDDATHYVVLFGTHDPNQVAMTKAEVRQQVDIGLGKLDGYVVPPDHRFPIFRVRGVQQGELLCRVGYPFVDNIEPKWNKEQGFSFTNLFPVPQFANEALVSRFVQLPGGRWIETSSPGLKGQSGGPLVDADGYICGI